MSSKRHLLVCIRPCLLRPQSLMTSDVTKFSNFGTVDKCVYPRTNGLSTLRHAVVVVSFHSNKNLNCDTRLVAQRFWPRECGHFGMEL